MLLRILTIICVLVAVLTAVIDQSWLMSRRGRGDLAVRILGITGKRNTSFRRFQYMPILITAVIIAIALGIGSGWINAAVYIAGTVVCFGAVMAGTGAIPAGTTAASGMAAEGDYAGALKASYRTGAVMGAVISAAGLFLLGAMFVFFKVENVIETITCLALGVSTTAVHLSTGGTVYSDAYSLALPDDDFTDITGSFSGTGADMMESYVLAGAAAIMMAQNGLDSSGVMSTFNLSSVTKYPLILLAAGIVASLIGVMLYRGTSGVNNSRSVSVAAIVSGLLTAAAAIYFSNYYLESAVYGISAVCGIAGGLILGEISRIYSYDSRFMMSGTKEDRRLNSHMPLISGLSRGMISTVLQTAIVLICIFFAAKFSSVYGIALAAVGFCSVTGTLAAANGLSQVSGSAGEAIRAHGEGADTEAIADYMDTVSVRTAPAAWTYTNYASALTLIALLTAVFYNSGVEQIDLLHSAFIGALFGGAAVPFVLTGIVIYSVRTTALVAFSKLGRGEDTGSARSLSWSVLPVAIVIVLPALVALFLGVECTLGFLIGTVITGCMIMPAICDSGEHFGRTAVRSLGSLIKLMVVLTAAFLPVFSEIGGLFF